MSIELCYEGLGLADWREVIDAFMAPEPCRPFSVRGTTEEQRTAMVAKTLKLDASETRYVRDYSGTSIRLEAKTLVKKLARYANHAAYVGWIEETLLAPLEVWRHIDPRSTNRRSVRNYYLAAYLGPDGVTSHLLIAAVAGRILINCYRLDGIHNANETRFGALLHIGYAPIYPPLPKAKGAPFPIAPLP